MEKTFVTIAIPTYSRPELLKEAVGSALAQTYDAIEILISLNPGSKDEAVLASWSAEQASADTRVRFQRNPQNVGMAGNWNACAASAQGEFMILLADDDRLLPNCIETLIAHAAPGVDVIFSNHYIIDGSGDRDDKATEAVQEHYCRNQLSAGLLSPPGPWVWQAAVPIVTSLMRTETVRRLRFRDELNTPEMELFARIAAEGGGFFFCKEYLGEYRFHGGSATAAGLMIERLLPALASIPVDAVTAPYKETQLSELARGVVARYVRKGDLVKAQECLRDAAGRKASKAASLKGLKGALLKLSYLALRFSPSWLVETSQKRLQRSKA